jgi:hypothetical protein
MLELYNCKDVSLIECTFNDKDTKGNFIHIKGKESKRNRIEGCTFKDHKGSHGNGREAIIVGGGQWSGCSFETHIIGCTFINCKADDEIVSIKSCENVFEGNTIKDRCNGNITIRHGGRNHILNNRFEGSGYGIRVLGDGNEIKGNIHKDNDHEQDNRRPLIIENGDRENDKHFEDGEPKCRDGDENYDDYARAKNNTIEDNTYEECKGVCVIWGRGDRGEGKFKPIGNTFKNNTLVANDKGSTFLEFRNNAGELKNKNTFEGNKMKGDKAKPGDLP